MSEYIINAFSFPDGPVPENQIILAENIYTAVPAGASGLASLVRHVGIGHVNNKIMTSPTGSHNIVFSDDAGTSWTEKPAPVAGTVGSVLYDESIDTWYISNGSYSGRWMNYYYSKDDGDTWTNIPRFVSTYNWAIALSSSGELITDGREFGAGGSDAMALHQDPSNGGTRLEFRTPIVGGNGFHVIESGGTYWGTADGGKLIELESTKTTLRSIVGSNVSISGWATDGSGLVMMPTAIFPSSSSASISRVTPGGGPTWPIDTYTFPSNITSITASYGNGVWLVAGSRDHSTVRNQVYIYMSASGDSGTFDHTISLQLSADRGTSPGPYGQNIEIFHVKGNQWLISYNNTSGQRTLDTFEFIPAT